MKKIPLLKSVTVKIIVTSPGGSTEFDLRSNVKNAKKPASPEETLVSAAREIATQAALYGNNGLEVIKVVTEAVASINKWKQEGGYEL